MRIPIPTIVIPIVVALLYLFVPGVRDLPWTPLRIAGAVLAVVCFGFAGVARHQLGDSFSVRPRAKELVTSGLYSKLRNPIYVFVDLTFVGVILVLELYWLFVVLAIVIVVQSAQAHREAKVLGNAFGQSYADYRKRTWF